jgi:Ser/Thr protein kinase RdoA (MazF antagonist)
MRFKRGMDMNFTDVNLICSQWDVDVKETKNLSERALLLITANEEKFVLKTKGDLQATKNENELLNYLKTNGINVQFPLMNIHGETIVTHNNIHYCLYNFIDGETFGPEESLKNPLIPGLLGETIASLHIAMEAVKFSHNFNLKNLYNMVSSYAINEILKVDNNEELKAIFEIFDEEFKNKIESLPKQLIHRDAHIFNIIYKDNELSGVIDFEIAEVNVRIFDICYCSTSVLNEIFFDVSQRENWFNFVEVLCNKYKNLNPLTNNEMNSIWHVMLCIQLIFMAYFSNNISVYENNKAMFLWIYENKDKLENKIFEKI